MTTANTKSFAVPPLRQALPIFVALVIAGLSGNYFKYELFFNIQFIFGSVFAMLALQILGLRLGILAAFIISSVTYQLWNHPYAIVIMTGEVVFVGLLVRRKNVRIVVADALYWICVGMPLVYLFYHGVMHLLVSTTTITMVKQSVNGIANTLAARLIFMSLYSHLNKKQFSLQEVVFNLLALSTLVTALFLVVSQSRSELTDTDHSIRGALGLANQRVTVNLSQWLQDHGDQVDYLARLASTESAQQIQQRLEQVRAADRDFLRVGLMNENATSVAFSPLIDELGQSNIGRNWSDRPFIPTLKRTLQPMLSEVVIGKVGRPKPLVIVLAPVVARGRYAGYIAGVLDLQRVNQLIALNASSQQLQGLLFTLVDKNGRIIVSNRDDLKGMDTFSRGAGELKQIAGGIFQWLPLSHKNVSISERWKSSFYVAESTIGNLAEWKLILEFPIAPVQKRLDEKYAAYLTEILAMLLIALVLAKMISQWVVASLEALKGITANIPDKLATNADIVWPKSTILETASLIDNFRETTWALALQMNEIRDINAVLEERVNERTRDLQESEVRFRSFFEKAKVVTLAIDPADGTLIDANEAAVSFYGWPRERLLAMKIFEINTLPLVEVSAMMELARSEKQSTFLYKHRLVDGAIRDVEVYSSPILISGKIVLYSIIHDITERKQMEESLRKSEALLKQTQQISRVGGWEYDVAGQRVTWTDEVYRIFDVDSDYNPNNIEQAISFFSGQDQTVMARSFKSAVEAGEAYDLELRLDSARGIKKWVRATGQAERAAGKIVRVFGHIMDITERKQAEIDREQYFKFFTTSADLMCIADPNGCFKKTNPACREMLGYDEDELIATPFIEFVYPDDRQATMDEMARQLQLSFSLDFENRYLCKDGSVRWLSWRATFNKDEGLTYATARDITEQKQVEEQIRQSLREKETLLKEVHHRVKNNMAVISSLLSLQARKIKDAPLRSMFEESQQRIKSISLVHEKLYRSNDLSRIDFGDYIRTITNELLSSYHKEGTEIATTITDEEVILDIDSAIPCGLIINELFTNALKHAFPQSRSGEVNISCTKKGDSYTLAIKDNGIGLPAGFDHTRTGTLGLQLVEALTGQLKGTLKFFSGVGTEIVITFSKKGE
jgi:PAS domain S-box-containing protein